MWKKITAVMPLLYTLNQSAADLWKLGTMKISNVDSGAEITDRIAFVTEAHDKEDVPDHPDPPDGAPEPSRRIYDTITASFERSVSTESPEPPDDYRLPEELHVSTQVTWKAEALTSAGAPA
ncbi:MAG: hypothetical protein F4059_09075 [Gemmatimonadetes bacterium]|nr:hypothetical protein [Gemmatimonadota bacterium]